MPMKYENSLIKCGLDYIEYLIGISFTKINKSETNEIEYYIDYEDVKK